MFDSILFNPLLTIITFIITVAIVFLVNYFVYINGVKLFVVEYTTHIEIVKSVGNNKIMVQLGIKLLITDANMRSKFYL